MVDALFSSCVKRSSADSVDFGSTKEAHLSPKTLSTSMSPKNLSTSGLKTETSATPARPNKPGMCIMYAVAHFVKP